jgi:glutamyl-tRNA synthetase
MNKQNIRVRFAPSPTGPLHIGGVRTALYNYLFAKKHGGKIILRIEDTDQQRYVKGAEDYILESLNWCGIHFDEDVKKGGPYGPYRQSERRAIYRQYAEQLVQNGLAYYAFDTEAELEVMRNRTNPAEANSAQYGPATRMHMKNALTLTEEEIQRKLNNGEPHVIRIKIPENEVIRVNDLIRGEVLVQSSNLDDKVLFKSDGWPTYHLANIVDDHLMEITHVIRGEEWLPSAPLHVLLYRYFGWEDTMPTFAHLPLLLKPDGPGKLSKRDGDRLGFPVFPLEWNDPVTREISSGYRESGYLPEAFINMLALLGWNPGTEQELFTMEQLIADFTLDRVGKHGSKFDPEKAKWFNHQYIQRLSNGELAEILRQSAVGSQQSAVGWFVIESETKQGLLTNQDQIEKICGLIKDRVVLIPDLWRNASFFFIAPEIYDEQVFQKVWKPETTGLVKSFADEAALIEEWTQGSIHSFIEGFILQKGIKMGQLMNPLRLLVVGSNQGPGMMDILHLLGKEESVDRIIRGVERVGG